MKIIARPGTRVPIDNIDLAPAYDCPAIQRCAEAWYRAYQNAETKGVNPISVRLRANEAYRYAMPPLNTPENVRDFLACVVHGMMVGAIIDELGSIWIRAARAAYGMCETKPNRPNPGGRPSCHPQTDDDFENPENSGCVAVSEDLTTASSETCEQEQAPEKGTISEQAPAPNPIDQVIQLTRNRDQDVCHEKARFHGRPKSPPNTGAAGVCHPAAPGAR